MLKSITNIFTRIPKDVWIHLILVVLFFLTKIFGHHSHNRPHFHTFEVWFFANYFIAIIAINYWLLPRFFYQKKYWQFTVGVVIAFTVVIIIEEFVLEQIFFAQSRGTYFPGIFYTLGDVTPPILFFVGAKLGWDMHIKQNELDKLKNLMTESELKFLKSQINPHFLFNNLNNLYAYALENSPQTPTIILQLSSLLRYMLYDGAESQVALEKEIKYLKDFVDLQKLQIEDRGHILFETKGNISNLHIAPLILVVFIENCFKHSTSSQARDIYINIHIEVKNNWLELHCNNTFSDNKNTDDIARGIGLANVKSRLALLYPQQHLLSIEQKNNVHEVRLKLNLNGLK